MLGVLIGRSGEGARLDRLVADAKAGQSGVLVVRGASGTGKTALLEYVAERAGGGRVVRAGGMESEMELPFAGLHELCAPLLDGLNVLPTPQREALEIAFGLASGGQPDRFLISLAVLTLLSEAAEERLLLCLVDDAQWLDRSSAQVLAFVARRLQAESVVLLFAIREPLEVDELARLPQLSLAGLSGAHARELLASAVGAPLDERVRGRILAEARGNPLALLELPRDLEHADRFDPVPPVESRIEASFRRRVEKLPTDTRRVLVLAAAEPTGEPALLWRSAAGLGIALEAVEPAIDDGMLELGTHLVFRHPVLRSAIYGAASAEERQTAHAALAEATDAEADPDRRAWHRARAALGPDEEVADELERSAGRAQARGGVAAAAAFLARAAALTLDRGVRARRSLAAAAAKQLAGAPEEALTLLAEAADGPLDELDRATVQSLRGQIALDLRRGDDAVSLLCDAAKRFEAFDPGLARATYAEALRAASIAGRLGAGTLEVARAARDVPPRPGPPRAIDLLLDGLAARFTDGYAAGAPALKRALVAVREEVGQDVRWPWIARRVAPDLFDPDTWRAIATRSVRNARESGALAVLPLTLNVLALLRCFEGELAAAAALLDEADEIAEATATEPMLFGRVLLAGCRGDEQRGLELIEASETTAVARREGLILTFGEHARALLYNGLGQPAAALAPAQRASERDELLVSVWSLPELVEAASRCGREPLAGAAVERLAERTEAAGTDLALGIEARGRALVSKGMAAEKLHHEAIERLECCGFALDLARAHLLFGEWLRREQRRVDAREQLRAAHELFDSIGSRAFAERARRELLATGESVRARTPDARAQLTAQEAQIAQLARDGFSNPEIAARLFISRRTVQYHLRKVFAKLGISSRSQLHRALPDGARVA